MGRFISWIELPALGGTVPRVLFLTDKDVYSKVGLEILFELRGSLLIGHEAIRAFYDLKPNEGTPCENTMFWEKENFPSEIAQYLESPQTLIDTWGRMLREAMDSGTALSIMKEAPRGWGESLSETCLDVISRNAGCSYLALRDFEWLPEDQRDRLVEAISADKYWSHVTMDELESLTEGQRDILADAISRNPEYSYRALRNVRRLLDEDRLSRIVGGVLDSIYRSYCALDDFEWLPEDQRDRLVEAVSRSADFSYLALICFFQKLTGRQQEKLKTASSKSWSFRSFREYRQ
jgi:hypothetical protein